MKKILSLAVVISLLSAILPHTMLTALAYTTTTTDTITIYETDFEDEYENGINWNEVVSENATIGGWEALSNANIGDLRTTSKVATGNHVLFGGTDRNKSHCTQFYIPESMTFTTGIYTFTFDYYHGDRTTNCWIGFNDKTSRNDGTEHECSLPEEFGCSTQNEWYSMEISIDIGNHTSTWTSYGADGDEITSKSWDDDSSEKLAALTTIKQISFETKNGNSTGTDADYNFWLPGIDNVKITYTPTSPMTIVKSVSGNIYSDDFEDWNGVQKNENYITEGGWQFGNGENDRAGMSWGRYASKGFAAAFSPGSNSVIRDEYNYSTYYLPHEDVISEGIYTIGYDFYLGSKSGGDWLEVYATQDTNGDADYERELHWNPVKATENQWYHCNLEIDVENHTYDITICYENGSQRYHDSGEYTPDTVAAVRFSSKGGGNLAGEYNNLCSYSSAIDNLEISRSTNTDEQKIVFVNEGFESGVESATNYLSRGGFVLAENAGMDTGYNSSNALCVGWTPGKNTTKNEEAASAYYLSPSKLTNTGRYTIKCDYWRGEKTNHNYIYLSDDGTNWQRLTETTYGASLGEKVWYVLELVIDLDEDKYDLTFYNGDGSIKYTTDGEYTSEYIRAIKIGSNPSNNLEGKYHLSGHATKIDNLYISAYLGPKDNYAALMLGGSVESVDSEYFKINGNAMTQKVAELDDAKIYTAVYGNNGRLLDCGIGDYSEEFTTKQFKKSYDGTRPTYAKMFVWSGQEAKSVVRSLVIPPNFDNSTIYVLAIGNSFSQDSVKKIKNIAAADGISIEAYNAFVAGRTLEEHYSAWNDATKTYRMQPNGDHTDTYKTLKEFAAMEDWDYVMLQGTTNYNTYDKGLWNENPANTTNYWTTLKNGIAGYAPNAKRLVNATWSPINELVADFNGGEFADGTPDSRGAYLSALLPNEQIGANIYSTETRADGGKEYIPVGVAIDYLVRYYRFPEYIGDIEDAEYDNSSTTRAVYRDRICHLTENVGRVLAGLVWYEMITGIPATENAYERDTLSNRDMEKLKAAAHYACQNYATYDPAEITPIAYETFDAEITKSKNGADATVVIVHDDGSKEVTEYLGDEFKKNNLNGTVAIIGKNITTQSEANEWQEIFDDAEGRINFASHSYYHEYMGQTDEEHTNYFSGVAKIYPAGYMTQTIANERTRLNGLFPNERILTFVKPGVTKPDGITTQLSNEARAMIRDHYIAMRDTGGGVDTIPPEDNYHVLSLMAKVGECELADWRSNLTSAINKKGLLVYLFHGIDTSASGLTSAESDVSALLSDIGIQVAAGKVWSAKFDEAMQYAQEFGANPVATVTANYNANNISVTVTDEISRIDTDEVGKFKGREMYDYPLTVKAQIPFDWDYVKLTQNYYNRVETAKTFIEDGVRYAYVNVVPDQGAAILTEVK